MLQNILNNNNSELRISLVYDEYYDFMLYGRDCCECECEPDQAAEFDFSKIKGLDGRIYSQVQWDRAVNGGVTLKNIGLTGVDNGIIKYEKDRITNAEFLDLYTKSEMKLDEGDLGFFFQKVDGNTQEYVYPISIENSYLACRGGLLQGFFKLHDREYQTLPSKVESAWNFNFRIRPRSDYKVEDKTLNYYQPENNGLFFYIGTRAENKWWNLYKTDGAITDPWKNGIYSSDGYCTDIEGTIGGPAFNDGYLMDEEDVKPGAGYEKPGTGLDACQDMMDGYIQPDIDLSKEDVKTDTGYGLETRGVTRIETDNKFILFDHTPDGFTTDNWVEGTMGVIDHIQPYPNVNYFPLFHYGEGGYTTDTAEDLKKEKQTPYNILSDIYGNSLAFKINKDGSIGYSYAVKNCELPGPDHLEVLSESSKPGMIKMDEWNDVRISLERLGDGHKCMDDSNSQMKVYIWVNGFLKFISKPLPMIVLKALDDLPEKQEGVPYNMSLGGGTQGLAEAIYLDYYYRSPYKLPIERNFAGSFLGDISYFSFTEKRFGCDCPIYR